MATFILLTRLSPEAFADPNSDAATKVALLIRSFGHGTTETWIATPWDRFVEIAKNVAA